MLSFKIIAKVGICWITVSICVYRFKVNPGYHLWDMTLTVIKIFLLLSLADLPSSVAKVKTNNTTDLLEGLCSLTSYQSQANCTYFNESLICSRGFTNKWIMRPRYEIIHLKILDWPGDCINVGRLQKHFPELQTLHISNSTVLKYLKGHFDSESKIKKIDIHGLTSLWEVPAEVVQRMMKLEVLDLRNNVLRHMKANLLRGPPHLDTVYLSVIKIFLLLSLADLPSSVAKVKTNNTTDLLEGLCSLTSYQSQANCTYFNESLICSRGFTNKWIMRPRYEIIHLKILDWPGDCINVGRLQKHFPELQTLHISNSTVLKYLKGHFDSESKIKKIDIHGLTSLWEVPAEVVQRMMKLEVLDLRNNVLRHMKANLLRGPPHLDTVYLSDNNWDCSDGGLDWLAMEKENGTVRAKLVDYYKLVCHQQLYRGKPLHKVMDIIRMVRETCPEPCICAMTHVVSDSKGAVIPLITVDCSRKQMEDPPIYLPPSTTTLRLEGNKINSIRQLAQAPQYKRLLNLFLDNNNIQSVKELEGSELFSTFRVLSLKGNMLKQIPVYVFDKAFQSNNDIMHVYLGNNPWRCDCHFIPRFQALLLKYKSVIRDLADIRCAKSDDKTISLAQMVRETCPEPCICAMTHVVSDSKGAVIPLITVDCSRKQMEDPPTYLPPSTTTLRLEGNKINSIRQLAQAPQYKRLLNLFLDNNNIQSVKELEGSELFSTFRVLSLKGNMLKQIPVYVFDKAFQSNNDIMHVYLGNNPWRCDCHFIPRFQALLLKYKRVIRDLADIRCAKSDDKTISLAQISTMSLSRVCSASVEMPISIMNIVNLLLLLLILSVVGRFIYDWHRFRSTGKLPWISSILP